MRNFNVFAKQASQPVSACVKHSLKNIVYYMGVCVFLETKTLIFSVFHWYHCEIRNICDDSILGGPSRFVFPPCFVSNTMEYDCAPNFFIRFWRFRVTFVIKTKHKCEGQQFIVF